eukprot:CAMPEP_0202347826 /NCGR_PEP_ID=MMETSP1126-20121109/6022_1 /ASSEMBLY_ACC=CAM_ASM_000457 /TAXON_ID=3047 /ORGANISM="Dunaliella tertiolecta, Strain CCMP1320" /LENGTH=197 /DNA_ID=CAMNT_0048939433 /DNA_START=263 /DNA_END=856 /DNA_ORIENTATION=+
MLVAAFVALMEAEQRVAKAEAESERRVAKAEAESERRVAEAEAEQRVVEAERRADEAIMGLLRMRLFSLQGLLNMRGAIEHVEFELGMALGVQEETRLNKWTRIFEARPQIRECVARALRTSDTRQMGLCMRDIYNKLSGHTHSYQTSFDTVDVVVGIVDAKEAQVLKCVFEACNIQVQIKKLFGKCSFNEEQVEEQ